MGVTFESEKLTSTAEIHRKWRGRNTRKGSAPKAQIIWFGANEAVAKPLRGQKFRSYRSRTNRKQQQSDDRFLEREEFLYREIFMMPPSEHDHIEFGDSTYVRFFVSKILSKFSDKFRLFGWRFVPYDCTVHAPDIVTREPLKAAAFRRSVQFETMRLLETYGWDKRDFRGWGERRSALFDVTGQQLDNEKSAISLPELPSIFSEVKEQLGIHHELVQSATVELKLAPRISVDGPDGTLLLSQLSDGEKRIFSMIVDIARQLSRRERGWRDIGNAPGIVVIDEIDCHLHPKWQRMIVKALEDLFKGCQFIVTTHSPFIVQAIPERNVIQLSGSILGDFNNRGIEEIAFKVMGIEDRMVSARYLDMLDAARNYFRLLEEAPNAEKSDLIALKAKLDGLTQPYADDPAYQAFLEMNRRAAFKE